MIRRTSLWTCSMHASQLVRTCSRRLPRHSAGFVSWLVQQLELVSRQALIAGIKKARGHKTCSRGRCQVLASRRTPLPLAPTRYSHCGRAQRATCPNCGYSTATGVPQLWHMPLATLLPLPVGLPAGPAGGAAQRHAEQRGRLRRCCGGGGHAACGGCAGTNCAGRPQDPR